MLFKYKFLQLTGDSHLNDILGSSGSGQHLAFSGNAEVIRIISKMTRIMDWASLLMILLGLALMASSLFGNSGQRKKSGSVFVWTGYSFLLLPHIAIYILSSFGNLIHFKWLTLLLIITAQVLMFVAPTAMYMIGAQNYELYEMSAEPSRERQAASAFRYISITMLTGTGIYLLLWLIGGIAGK